MSSFIYINRARNDGDEVNGAGAEVITGDPIALAGHDYRSFGFQTVYNEPDIGSEGLVATIAVEISYDPTALSDPANAKWRDITAKLDLGEAAPDGDIGGDDVNISFLSASAFRLVITGSASTGSLLVFVNGVKGA